MEARLAKIGLDYARRLLGRASQPSAKEIGHRAGTKAYAEAERRLAAAIARDRLVLRGESAMRNLTLRRAPRQLGLDGGHVVKELKVDQLGRRYMAKGAFGRQEYRAIGDKVGSDVVRKLGLESPVVHLGRVKIGGKRQVATIQPFVKHSGERLPWDPHQLTRKQVDQLTESQVARWLIGDHDGKVANFLVKEGGDVVTIDLGNMYRHFPKDRLAKDYVPNWEEPVYNRIWKAFTKGTLEVDFAPGMRMVRRIERMSDRDFVRAIEPYVRSRYKSRDIPAGLPTPESFLRAALQRKRDIRADFTAFYQRMARERALALRKAGKPAL